MAITKFKNAKVDDTKGVVNPEDFAEEAQEVNVTVSLRKRTLAQNFFL